MRNFPKNYFHPTKYPVLTKVSIKLRVRKVRRYSIWEGKDKIKYLRACVVFCVWYVVCEEEWKKIQAWGEKQSNLPSSFYRVFSSRFCQKKHKVRMNLFVSDRINIFSAYIDRFQPYSKTWQNETSFDQTRVQTQDLRIMNRITFPLHQQTKWQPTNFTWI